MEFTALDFWLITLFNASVCLSLPRLITLDWSNILIGSWQKIDKSYQPAMEVREETPT